MLQSTLSSNQPILIERSIGLMAAVPRTVIRKPDMVYTAITVGLRQPANSVRIQTMQLILQCEEVILDSPTTDPELTKKFLKYAVQQVLKQLVKESDQSVLFAGHQAIQFLWTSPCRCLQALHNLLYVINKCNDSFVPADAALRPALITALSYPSMLVPLQQYAEETLRRIVDYPQEEDLHLLYVLLDIPHVLEPVCSQVLSALHTLVQKTSGSVLLLAMKVLLAVLDKEVVLYEDHVKSFQIEMVDVLMQVNTFDGIRLASQCIMKLVNKYCLETPWAAITVCNLIESCLQNVRGLSHEQQSPLLLHECRRSIIILGQIYEKLNIHSYTMISNLKEWRVDFVAASLEAIFLNTHYEPIIRVHALEASLRCRLNSHGKMSDDVLHEIENV